MIAPLIILLGSRLFRLALKINGAPPVTPMRQKKMTNCEPLTVGSTSRPNTPAEWQPGPWVSPIDDVSDENLEDEAGGPEKQPRDNKSPVRV